MRGFFVRESSGVRIVTPYDPGFVASLKEGIPYGYRSFDGESKSWTVYEPYIEDGIALALEAFDEMEELYSESAVEREVAQAFQKHICPTSSPASHGTGECLRRVQSLYPHETALHVMPAAPFAVIQAAYRALAKMLHPDRSGGSSHQAMVDVNRAYEALERQQEVRS
jgi:hypothetical protein